MKTKDMSKQPRPYARLVTISNSSIRRRAMVFTIAALICCAGVAIAVRAYNTKTSELGESSSITKLPAAALPSVVTPQSGAQTRSRWHTKLALQPEADRMRRRLGQRLAASGRELLVMTGTLSVGAEQHAVRIVRSQEEEGERVGIALDGETTSLTWSSAEGARAANRTAIGDTRALIERIALDSPDQFVLAQLRGASYFNLAWGVKPAEAGDFDNYTGPLWNLVRIGEPQRETISKPQSLWRVYYINASTGMIDKIVSEEQGATIEAELSGWVRQAGEMMPTNMKWSRAGQLIMELSFNNVAYAPAQ